MNELNLIVSSSPHIRAKHSTASIMQNVIIALLPALAVAGYVFGVWALALVAICIISSVVTEAVIQKLLKKPVTINDWSAVVTGVLLAFNLPVNAPWWLAVIGSVFAIAIVKQCFGGLGQNFINPALAARAFLLASWPLHMTSTAFIPADSVTTATPLALLKAGEISSMPSTFDLFTGLNITGSIGEISALALILGGLYLIFKGIISWRIPTIYILTVGIFALLVGQDPLLHIFSGGLMLGAFFMATDYPSSPVTVKGQIAYAIGCGLFTMIIRLYGGYPEGVMFAILLMNVATPLIERFTKERIYGVARKKKEVKA